MSSDWCSLTCIQLFMLCVYLHHDQIPNVFNTVAGYFIIRPKGQSQCDFYKWIFTKIIFPVLEKWRNRCKNKPINSPPICTTPISQESDQEHEENVDRVLFTFDGEISQLQILEAFEEYMKDKNMDAVKYSANCSGKEQVGCHYTCVVLISDTFTCVPQLQPNDKSKSFMILKRLHKSGKEKRRWGIPINKQGKARRPLQNDHGLHRKKAPPTWEN